MVSQISVEENNRETHTERKPLIGLRWILVITIFFTLNAVFFIRNCLSVAIVAMVNSTSSSIDSELDTEDTTDVCPAASNRNDSSESDVHDGEFYWTTFEQGLILGAYFWGFVSSRLLLSRMSEQFGVSKSMTLGLLIAGVFTLLSPLCAEVSPYLLAANRFIIGLGYGPNPAGFQCLFAAWAPRNQLGIMTTLGYSGVPIGGLLGLVVSGWLSENFGWRSIFYVGGVLTLIVSPLWIFVIRDSPRDHPFLSPYERNILKDNMNIRTQKTVPWKKIATSIYVNICIYCIFARYWMDFVTSLAGPSFLTYKIGLDLDTASYVNGGAALLSFFTSILYGASSDFIISRNYMTKINTRKLFHFIGTGITPLILLGVILAHCDKTTVMVLWVILGLFYNATMVSFTLSTIDFAPNYAGVINGFMAIGALAGALAPSVTSALLKQENGWNKSFYVAICLNFVSCFLYVFFMTADEQPWNFNEDVEEERTGSETAEKDTIELDK